MKVRRTLRISSFDSAEYLDSEDAVIAYIKDAIDTNDASFIAYALGTVARARGMSQIARRAGISRESLYRALSKQGNPEFNTIIQVMSALGLTFSVKPCNPASRGKFKGAA
jgi:probable addiction module antidote protein